VLETLVCELHRAEAHEPGPWRREALARRCSQAEAAGRGICHKGWGCRSGVVLEDRLEGPRHRETGPLSWSRIPGRPSDAPRISWPLASPELGWAVAAGGSGAEPGGGRRASLSLSAVLSGDRAASLRPAPSHIQEAGPAGPRAASAVGACVDPAPVLQRPPPRHGRRGPPQPPCSSPGARARPGADRKFCGHSGAGILGAGSGVEDPGILGNGPALPPILC
jgi:hypothetical protein